MNSNLTFTLFRPHVIEFNNLGPIIELINRNGYKFRALKMVKMSREKAGTFYEIHKEKSFFKDLINYMTSGPIVVAVIEKTNAVKDFRTLIGNTDPIKAKPGTIRHMFAETMKDNAIHGSDSDENAKREIDLFFSPEDIFI